MLFAFATSLTDQGAESLSILFAVSVKSIVIFATAAALARVFRHVSARVRHVLWCAALFCLLALPLFSVVPQPLRLPVLPSGLFPEDAATMQTSLDAPERYSAPTFTTIRSAQDPRMGHSEGSGSTISTEQPSSVGISWVTAILLIWFFVSLLFLCRLVVGAVIVRNLVANSNELNDPVWSELKLELSTLLGLARPIRIMRSDERIMPMTCGIFSAVVLLPNDADLWTAERRRIVVHHELAHIKRRDTLTQTIAQVICAFYWFNPFVWWAAQQIRVEQEWACDECVVASGIWATDYATHLLDIARQFRTNRKFAPVTTAMACPSQLSERLCSILKFQDRYRSGRLIALSLVVMSVVFVSTIITRLAAAEVQNEPNTSDAMVWTEPSVLLGGEVFPDELSPSLTADPGWSGQADHTFPQQASSPAPTIKPADPAPTPPLNAQDPGEESALEVFNTFSQEEQARLMSNGVGPAYIEEMREAGYPRLSCQELIALISNGVHASYVARMGAVGYGRLSTSDLLSLKANGITPEVISSFQAVKHADFQATNYGSLVSNGVTPSYIGSLNDVGYDYLTANKIIGMRLAGITSDFIRDARSRSNADLSPNELIELKRREKP